MTSSDDNYLGMPLPGSDPERRKRIHEQRMAGWVVQGQRLVKRGSLAGALADIRQLATEKQYCYETLVFRNPIYRHLQEYCDSFAECLEIRITQEKAWLDRFMELPPVSGSSPPAPLWDILPGLRDIIEDRRHRSQLNENRS